MTVNKQFKQNVRSRQQATGEPYTLARRHVLAEHASHVLSSLVTNSMWQAVAEQLPTFVPDEPTLTVIAAATKVNGRPSTAGSWTKVTQMVARQHRSALASTVIEDLSPIVVEEWAGGLDPLLVLEAQVRMWEPHVSVPAGRALSLFDAANRSFLRTTIQLAKRFNDSAAQLHPLGRQSDGVTLGLPEVTYPCEACGEYNGVSTVDLDWPMGVENGDPVTGRGWHCSDRLVCDQAFGITDISPT